MALAVLPGCVLYEILTISFGIGANVAAVPTVLLLALLRWLSLRYSLRTIPPRLLRASHKHEAAARRRHWRQR